MSEKTPSALDEMLGLGDVQPGQKNVGPEGELIGDEIVEPKGPPPEDLPPVPGQAKDPDDQEPEYTPLPDGEAGDQPVEDAKEGDTPESKEVEEDQISQERRELTLYQKLLAGENPYEGESGADLASPPDAIPTLAATTLAAGGEGQKATETKSKASDSEVEKQLEDPFEGLEPDDPERIRGERLLKVAEYRATKNALSRVGPVVEAAFDEKETARKLMLDTFDKFKWLREPGRAKAFDISMYQMQQANPGITDGRKLLDMTANAMAKALNIDPKSGDYLGQSTTEKETEAPASEPPPPEKKTKKTRGTPKKKLTGEAAVIADSMKGFRDGGFF